MIASGLGWPEGPAVLAGRQPRVCRKLLQPTDDHRRRSDAAAIRLCGGRAEFLRARRGRRDVCLPERRHGGSVARQGDDDAVHPARAQGRQGRDPHHQSRIDRAQRPQRSRLRRRRTAGIHRPRHLQSEQSGSELHLRLGARRRRKRADRLPQAGVPERRRRRGPMARSSGTNPTRATSDGAVPTERSRTSAACPATIPSSTA